MNGTAPVVRPVQPGDVEGGAACQLACWREAYEGLIDPQVLARLTGAVSERIAMWRQGIAESWPITVAVLDDDVVGFAIAGPDREPDLDVGFKLFAMNVRRAWWGSGLAARLHEVAVGERDAYLWVLHNNGRARAFYRRNGYVADGVERVDPDFAATIVRMVRRAGPVLSRS